MSFVLFMFYFQIFEHPPDDYIGKLSQFHQISYKNTFSSRIFLLLYFIIGINVLLRFLLLNLHIYSQIKKCEDNCY